MQEEDLLAVVHILRGLSIRLADFLLARGAQNGAPAPVAAEAQPAAGGAADRTDLAAHPPDPATVRQLATSACILACRWSSPNGQLPVRCAALAAQDRRQASAWLEEACVHTRAAAEVLLACLEGAGGAESYGRQVGVPA